LVGVKAENTGHRSSLNKKCEPKEGGGRGWEEETHSSGKYPPGHRPNDKGLDQRSGVREDPKKDKRRKKKEKKKKKKH